MRRRCGGWGGWRCGGGAEAELSRCSGTAVARWCGARQCNAEAVCGGSAVWCAQQQPIALNPGVDGADLADLKAHNVTSEDQRSAGRRWVACRWPRQCAPAQTCRGGRAREIPFRGNLKGKLSVFQLDVFTLECGATHKSAPPGHCSHTLGSNAAAPLPAKDKGQRNYQSAYITLPVLGSMRLPATKPVVGSVPFGRRKSRMCGSGLAAAGAGQAQRECATRWRMRQGSGDATRDDGTCGWNSAPTRGSAARLCRATPYHSAAAPWVQSWQCAWAR